MTLIDWFGKIGAVLFVIGLYGYSVLLGVAFVRNGWYSTIQGVATLSGIMGITILVAWATAFLLEEHVITG